MFRKRVMSFACRYEIVGFDDVRSLLCNRRLHCRSLVSLIGLKSDGVILRPSSSSIFNSAGVLIPSDPSDVLKFGSMVIRRFTASKPAANKVSSLDSRPQP